VADVHVVLVAPGLLSDHSIIALEEEERHHLQVRRAVVGQPVKVLDGAGGIAEGRLVREGKEFAAAVGSVERQLKPPEFFLVVGAGDKDRFAWLAEKAAELGVTDLVPLMTERTSSVATGVRETHIPALQRRARQAIKQSLAAWAPSIHAPRSPTEAAELTSASQRWLGDVNSEPPPPLEPTEPVIVVVGPEGGLTDPERAFLHGAGFTPVRLAPDLLRFETAALAAAAVVASQRPRRPQ